MMKLLLIEDDREIAAALRHVLSSDYTLTLAPTGAQGLSEAAKQKFDGIILDLHLPDATGLDVCRQIRNEGLDTPVFILTVKPKSWIKSDCLMLGRMIISQSHLVWVN